MDWNNKLKEEYGIDYSALPAGYTYVETAYMFCKLISDPFVNRTFEAGVGLSTLVMADISERLGKDFVSFEDKPVWADRVNGRLKERNSIFRVISTDSKLENAPTLTEPFDLAWIDGNVFWDSKIVEGKFCHRTGGVRYYKDVLMDAVIIFDDGENINALRAIKPVISELGRDPDEMFLSSPLKRRDRNQLVSLPRADHVAGTLIKEMGYWYPVTDLPTKKG